MKKTKVRKFKLTKGEKLIYSLAVFCFCFSIVLKIFCVAGVNNISMKVEKIRYEISIQENKNESLTMKVNELTSFDKVKDVVQDMGLAYNNDNIIIINN